MLEVCFRPPWAESWLDAAQVEVCLPLLPELLLVLHQQRKRPRTALGTNLRDMLIEEGMMVPTSERKK